MDAVFRHRTQLLSLLVGVWGVFTVLFPPLAAGFTAYNDLAWGPGQRQHNITMITSPNGGSGLPSSGELIDFHTGQRTGVTLTVAGGEFDPANHIEASGEPRRGEALRIFDGNVSALGSISYQSLPPPEGDLKLTFTRMRPDARYTLVFYGHRNRHGWDRASRVQLSGAVSFTNTSSIGGDDNNRSLFSGPTDPTTLLPADNDPGWVARLSDINPGEDGSVVLTIRWDGPPTSRRRYRGKYANAVMLREIRNFTAYNDLAWAPDQLQRRITMITSPRGESGLPRRGQLVDFVTGRSTSVTLTVRGGRFNPEHHINASGSPAPGTEAFTIFNGKVAARGSISYINAETSRGNLDLILRGIQSDKRYALVFYGHRDRYGWDRASLVELIGAAFFTNASSRGIDDNGEPLFASPADSTTRLPADNDAGWVARFTNIYPGRDGEIVLRIRWNGKPGSAFLGKYANAFRLQQTDAPPLTVNSTADAIDTHPGDGICATATGVCTLRAALQETNALEGFDLIQVPAGTYRFAISGADEEEAATGDLDIIDNVTLVGAGVDRTLVGGSRLDRILHIHGGNTVILEGLTLQHGVAPDGGGIRNDGRVTLINSRVHNNVALGNAHDEAGGGMYNNFGSTAVVIGSRISHNTAGQRGGTGGCDGGGLYNRGTATLANATIHHNTAISRPGGGCDGAGGGLLNRGRLQLLRSVVRDNTAGTGTGGVASIGGAVTIVRSTIANSVSSAGAGGLEFVGTTATVTESKVTGNRSRGMAGGGIGNDLGSALTITHSTISANTIDDIDAIGSGGGIHNHLSRLIVRRSTISRNTAAGSGGGLMNVGGLATVTHSTFSGNIAHGLAPSEGNGGAVWTAGRIRIENSTISTNRAGRHGGGIDGPAELVNSILAANTAAVNGPDCHGGVRSAGHNLIGDPRGCADMLVSDDITGASGLGPFTDDGLPGNGYFPLLPQSRAINAGDETVCGSTDQLGQPRTDTCDIGAIEFF